jgi:hypothetical protein
MAGQENGLRAKPALECGSSLLPPCLWAGEKKGGSHELPHSEGWRQGANKTDGMDRTDKIWGLFISVIRVIRGQNP